MKIPRAIVLITSSFPIAADGSEAAGAFVADFVEELATHMPVRVVAPGICNAQETWGRQVDVFRYAAPLKPLSTLRLWHPCDVLSIKRVLRDGQSASRQAVDFGETAHILALWALPSGHWAKCASQETNTPYSVWTLGSDIWSLGCIPGVRGYLHRVLRDASKCFSDGLKLADDTRDIARREVDFLPSTRRISRVRTAAPRSDPPYRLLFLGRWHRNKGIDLLLDALGRLSHEDWLRIEIVEIYGGGPLEKLVRAGVDALRISGRPVRLRGYLDKSQAEDAILHADYLLLPSRLESIPVVFSDAMKLACPVISTPTGDLRRLISDEPACGAVAEAISAEAFASVISKTLSEPRERFTKGIGLRADQFDLSLAVHQLLMNLKLIKHDERKPIFARS